MPIRKFSIEWPDDHGPLWMNTSNLLVCLTQHCRNTRFNVMDITGDGQANEQPETAGPIGGPKSFPEAATPHLPKPLTEGITKGGSKNPPSRPRPPGNPPSQKPTRRPIRLIKEGHPPLKKEIKR